MENMFKRLLSLAIAFVMIIGMIPGNALSVFAAEEDSVIDTESELATALAAGGTVTLGGDITVDNAITAIDGTVIDLNGKTLYINVENSYYNNVTIKNGNIVLGKDDVHTCDGYFLVNEGKTLVLDSVKVTSAEGGIKAYAVFHLKTGANLDLLNSTLEIGANEYEAGYVVYAGESTATVDITGTTLTAEGNGIVHAAATIDDSTITINAQEHGINRSAVSINDSTVTISGGTGRGITAQHGDLTITGTSEVTITDMGEATIELRGDKNLTVAETATVTVDAEVSNTTNGTITGTVKVSTGSVTPAYTGTAGYWGEGTANASESYVVKLYEGSTEIASASLNNIDGIIDGDVFVTWNIPFAGSTDEYWTVAWAEGYPNIYMAPDKVALVADGVEVSTNNVQLNGPDDLNKIVALAEGFTGGVVAYTTLTDAIGNFNGRKVNVLRDVTESIEDMNGCTLTTTVEGGVTITNTYDDWIYCNDLSIGSGVTVIGGSVFYETDGVNTIEGTLKVTETFYHGYNAKTTVQNGGNIIVEGENASTILRYNEDSDAGLYIYGDGDDSTVEFSNSYYIGAYSGTFYAEDATIKTGYFLLKNSYDDSSYADINMTLDNSSLTVVGTNDTQDSFIVDDQASLTLVNGSSIKDVRDFSVLAGTNLTLSIDETSSVSATNVSIADDVALEATKNEDGTISFKQTLKGTGTAEDPILIGSLADLKLFRDTVNTYTSDGSNQFKGKYVKLTADIDLAGENWEPIGTNSVGDHMAFLGTFDGDGHTISNLYVNGDGGYLGFFARVGSYGEDVTPTVKNITFNNVDVSSNTTTSHTGSYVGGVIANAGGNSVISNIKVTGDVYIAGYGYVGGIVGHGYPDIDNCHVTANDGSYLNCYYWCGGGIIGYAGEGGTPITNCSVSGLDIWSAYGGAAAIAGLLQDGNKLENVSASNVDITSASDYCMGYIAGNGEASTMTNVTATNVTATANGKDITPTDAVATVDGVAYFDLQAALAAVEAGSTLNLYADATISTPITVTGDLTINGNGHTLTYTGTNRAIDVVKTAVNADVTIKELTVDCTASYCQRGINYNTNGTLTLDDVTVKGTSVTYALNLPSSSDNATVNITDSDLTGHIALNIWGENATINVTDTALTSVDTTDAENYVAVKLNNDGTTSAEGTVVTITGGSITAYDENNEPSNSWTNATATGKINVSDTTVVVGTSKETVAVVVYEGSNDYYACFSLQSAVDRAAESPIATVKLLKDVTLDEILTVSGDVVIDGNGKTITSTAGRAINIDTTGEVTIKNLTVLGGTGCQRGINIINQAGTTNLENVTVSGVSHYAVHVATSAGAAKVNIADSDLTGYAAVAVYGEGTSVAVTDSDLTGINTYVNPEGNTSNNYGTLAIHANNASITTTGGTITAQSSADNASERILSLIDNTGVTVSLDSELVLEGENTDYFVNLDPANDTVSVRAAYADAVINEGYAYTTNGTMITVIEVPELPTATVSKLDNKELTFALNFLADEVSEEQLAYYGDWYADFVLTVNKEVTFNANSNTSDGYLSGQYDAYSENWVNVPFEDVTLTAGQSLKIMEYAAELMGQSGLKLTYNDVVTFVKDFDCGVYLTPEFLHENPDIEITLELRMYNPADESESYVIGDTYTYTLPALPTATISKVENDDLTFAMNFTADEVTTEQLEFYGDWYADFELTVNKDITLNANGGADGWLSGQYDEWSENWVNVPFEDVTLKANEPLKIMAYAAELMGEPGLKYTYAKVYNVVKSFDCGMYLTPEFIAANPDVEITLELKMYDPADETHNHLIGQSYEFSFDYVAQNTNTGKLYNKADEALLDAAEGETVVLLKDTGDYSFIIVPAGIKLDLNGCTLGTDYCASYGHIVDNSEANSGVLSVPGNKLFINAGNEQMPVKTAAGYQFIVVLQMLDAMIDTDDEDTVKNTYAFLPYFEPYAHELLKAGVENTGTTMVVTVTWTTDDQTVRSQEFRYTSELVNQVLDSYNPSNISYSKMFTLDIANIEQYTDITFECSVVSDTGVQYIPD